MKIHFPIGPILLFVNNNSLLFASWLQLITEEATFSVKVTKNPFRFFAIVWMGRYFGVEKRSFSLFIAGNSVSLTANIELLPTWEGRRERSLHDKVVHSNIDNSIHVRFFKRCHIIQIHGSFDNHFGCVLLLVPDASRHSKKSQFTTRIVKYPRNMMIK